jgi:FYVE/RhoGEF/PH domain-containing protein 5/6
MMDIFYTPLTWNAQHSTNPILAKADIQLIFSNISQIRDLSAELCQLLQERVQHWSVNKLITDIFLRLGPFLKIYSAYCSGFDAANVRMHEVEQSKTFRAFWDPIREVYNSITSHTGH